MKIVVLAENIQKKLSFINKAVSLKSQLTILLHLLLEAKEGKLRISSTDLEIGIITEIPANIEKEGITTVPAKQFTELIASLPQEKITIEVNNNSLTVSTTKTKSVFQTLSPEEFPKLYEEKGKPLITLKKTELQKLVTKVVFAASQDVGRPALSGIHITIEEETMLFVATDGYRLSLKRYTTEKNNTIEETKTILVPSRVLKELLNNKEEKDSITIYIAEANNQILFEEGSTVLVGRLIDAQYPPYEKIIPKDFITQVFFDREELLKAVKISAIFAREAANVVRFSIKEKEIAVSANGTGGGENNVTVEAQVKGEEGEIAFNVRYLLDLLTNLEEKELVFEMTNSIAPGVFKIKGDSSFLHLIMPIRVGE